MKKIAYFLLALGIMFVADSCKKTGTGVNPLSDVSNLGTGAYLTLDATLNLNLNSTALATSKVGITVTQYPGGQAVDHIVLYVDTLHIYNPAKWLKVKSIPYAGPKTEVSCTGQDLATALAKPLTYFKPGTNYTFYTQVVTASGQTFDVSNTGNNSGSGLVTGPTYFSAFSFTAYIVCPFVGPIAGTYKVVRDDWADWNVGDLVQVTDGPGANQINLSKVYPNPAYGSVVSPLVVTIDQPTGTAYVPSVNFGNYGGGYNMVAVGINGATSPCGYVFSCTGFITLQMSVKATGPGGNAYNNGPTTLTLQKP